MAFFEGLSAIVLFGNYVHFPSDICDENQFVNRSTYSSACLRLIAMAKKISMMSPPFCLFSTDHGGMIAGGSDLAQCACFLQNHADHDMRLFFVDERTSITVV